ncbi:hypothetical protein METHB2_580012 [Candidatus Methylobacter favarea]|uniref:Uncharacterized protein n=1 Tax=Candidatus Methylobacter favarea TaxID=2707345 RepID=A0A8S0WKM1_9GAMM|nr:hypothetical protein METHB2_580012 [Candidatus Methylobacter favarea]
MILQILQERHAVWTASDIHTTSHSGIDYRNEAFKVLILLLKVAGNHISYCFL